MVTERKKGSKEGGRQKEGARERGSEREREQGSEQGSESEREDLPGALDDGIAGEEGAELRVTDGHALVAAIQPHTPPPTAHRFVRSFPPE